MALFGRSQIGIKETSVKADVPNNNKARLMYYLNSICSLLDLDDVADIRRLRRYQNYHLSGEQTDRLIVLCYLLSPDELIDKVIFHSDAMCRDRTNRFYELTIAQTHFAVANSIVIGGQRKRVHSIMTFKHAWIERNWINPIRAVIAERRREKAERERERQMTSQACIIL